MELLVCAIFEDEREASAAVADLIDSGIDKDVIGALMQSDDDIDHEDLPVAAEQSKRRSLQGAAMGGALGALLGGLLAGPAGFLIGGPLAGILIGGTGGGLYGGLAGLIAGRDEDKPEVAELDEALHEGKVVVTVDIESRRAEPWKRAVGILADHGGRCIAVA